MPYPDLNQKTGAERSLICACYDNQFFMCTCFGHYCPSAMFGFEPKNRRMNPIRTNHDDLVLAKSEYRQAFLPERHVRNRTEKQNYESCPYLPRQPKPLTITFIYSGVPTPECCTRIRTRNRIPKHPTAPCRSDLFEREQII